MLPGDPSWWFTDALKAEGGVAPSPSLSGEITADVAIVGGGFTGLWTALALRERAPGLSVVLIEASLCGSGASGKNGGKTHGYWGSLGGIEASLGSDAALAVARAGTKAQDAIRRFATAPGRDVWWRESGNVRVSTCPAQDAKVAATEMAGLQDVVTPPPVAWRPQTAGWYVLGVLLLTAVLWLVWHRLRVWQARRYQREALAELDALTVALQEPARRVDALRALAELVKRTQLCEQPRRAVAALSGEAWRADLSGGAGGGACGAVSR